MLFRTLLLTILITQPILAEDKGPQFKDLRWFIRGNAIQSIDGFLQKADGDTNFGPLLENATYVFASQGSQRRAMSREYPGILTFQGNLLFSMTADPRKKNSFRTLEVIEYLPKEARYRFHSVHFSKNGKVRFKENDGSCVQCHRGKPLWGSSYLWPGAYGGNHDWIGATSSERVSFLKFLKKTHQRGRYQYMRMPGLGSPEIVSTRKTKGLWLKHRPNEKFAKHLQALNFHRIKKILEPEFQGPYRYAVAGALLNCPNPSSFLASKARRRIEKRMGKYMSVAAETRREMGQLFAKRARRYNRVTRMNLPISTARGDYREALIHEDLRELGVVAKLRFFLQGRKIPMMHWSMASRPGSYAFSFKGPGGGLGSLKTELPMPLGELGVDIANKNKACKTLQRKSVASTGGTNPGVARKWQSIGSVR